MIVLLCLVLAVAFLAFANGANDNFKGVATLHGSGTLGYQPALTWATVTTLAGSLAAIFLAGGLVRRFSGKGLVAGPVADDPVFLTAVAVGAAATVLLATRLGFPVSTTHALIGGLLGAGAVLAGPANLSLRNLGSSFILPLVLSPVVSLILAAVLYQTFRWARHWLGVSEELCVCVDGVEQMATFLPVGGLIRLGSGLTVTVDRIERCERRYSGRVLGFDAQTVLNRLHMASAGAVGFARGLNDTPKIVALTVGAKILGVADGMASAALLIALGGFLAAQRVARTMAFEITAMNHGQGFTANLVTAALVILASPLGLPLSTTHVSCGALFGIGIVNGQGQWRTIVQILSSWITTLPAAAALAAGAAFIGRTVK